MYLKKQNYLWALVVLFTNSTLHAMEPQIPAGAASKSPPPATLALTSSTCAQPLTIAAHQLYKKNFCHPLLGVALSPDGTQILVIPHAPKLVLLNTHTGDQTAAITKNTADYGKSALFSHDGKRIFLPMVYTYPSGTVPHRG